MKRPKWIILYHNSNANKIEKYNVFEHGGVRNDIADAVNVCKTKSEFEDKLKTTMQYYFWARAEWEVIVSPWVGGNGTKEIKIDVFDQVMYNWDIFLDYTWKNRKAISKWVEDLNKSSR